MKKDVDNFWIALEYDQKKSKLHQTPIKAKGFVGFDTVTKKFVTNGVDNQGGYIDLTGGPDGKGDFVLTTLGSGTV